MSAEYLLTSSIDPIVKGQEFTEEPLPRHVTVQQWFTLEGSQRAFENALQNLATTFEPFEVTAGDEALFGPNNDVLVRRLRTMGKLATLHARTSELLARYQGTLKNPQWGGDGYNPHVTYVDDMALEEGEVVKLRSIELIKRVDGTRRVEAALPFSKRS